MLVYFNKIQNRVFFFAFFLVCIKRFIVYVLSGARFKQYKWHTFLICCVFFFQLLLLWSKVLHKNVLAGVVLECVLSPISNVMNGMPTKYAYG